MTATLPLTEKALHCNHLISIVYFIGIFYHAKSGDKRGENEDAVLIPLYLPIKA